MHHTRRRVQGMLTITQTAIRARQERQAHHVEEEGIVGALDSMVQVSVWADDAGGLATQLQCDRLDPVSCLLHDELAHLSAASEGNLVNAGVLGDSCSCNFS